MYKNPLNAGKVSDYNSLKKQRNNASIIKKYESKKLEIEPTELQKYYQYLTYQQPILDELNYVAERMKNEDIKTKKDDFNFIEDLKIKREQLMKETSKKEEDIKKIRETLFDNASTIKNNDPTPNINTDVEMEYQTEPQPEPQIIKNTPITQSLMNGLFGEGDEGDENFNRSIADTNPIKEEKFELSKEKRYKTPEQLAEIEAKKAKKEAAREEKKAATIAKKAEIAKKNEEKPAEAKKKAAKGKKGKLGSKGSK